MNAETYLMDLKVKLAVSSFIQSVEMKSLMRESFFLTGVISGHGLFWQIVIFWKFQNILCVKMRNVSPKHININGWTRSRNN